VVSALLLVCWVGPDLLVIVVLALAVVSSLPCLLYSCVNLFALLGMVTLVLISCCMSTVSLKCASLSPDAPMPLPRLVRFT
jgi:hypothetical protein